MNCPLCGADNPATRISCVVCRAALGTREIVPEKHSPMAFLTERLRSTIKFLMAALLGGLFALLYFRFFVPEENKAASRIALLAVLCGGLAAGPLFGMLIPALANLARDLIWKFRTDAVAKKIRHGLDRIIAASSKGEETLEKQCRLGTALILKEERERALGILAKARISFPQDPIVLHNLAVVNASRSQMAQALEEFKEAQQLGAEQKTAEINVALATVALAQPEEAVAECRRAWEMARGRADVLNILAVCLTEAGFTEEALTRLQSGLQEQPANTDLMINLGVIRFRQGDLEGAFHRFLQACECETVPSLAHHNVGICLLLQGQFASARDYFNYVLREDAQFAPSLGQCAIIHVSSNNFKRAQEELRAAVRHTPTDFEIRHNLSVLLLQEGKTEEALTEAERAAELRPEDHDALITLTAANHLVRRYRSALTHSQKAATLFPESAPARFNLALALDMHERYDEAKEQLEWLTQRYPYFAGAWNNLGAILMIQGETVNAADAFIRASEILPDNPIVACNLAMAHYLEGDVDACKQQIEIVSKHMPESSALLDIQGHLQADQKYPHGAIEAWAKLAAVEPTNIEVLTNLGIAYYRDNQTDAGIEFLRKVLVLQPRSIFAHNNLALAYAKNKLLPEALHHISKVVELCPDNPIVHSNVGLIEFFRENTERAMYHWREVTRLSPAYAHKREATRLSTYDDSEMVLFKINCAKRTKRFPPEYAALRHEARFALQPPHFIPILPGDDLVEIQQLQEKLDALQRRLRWD